jgi:phenylacetate-CoA ligase
MGRNRDVLSRRRAAAAFLNARRKVPAYREFLRERGAEDVVRFDDIPAMDKQSYVSRWPLEALCQGGRLPARGAVIDESSGSTGTASNWIRGPRERDATRRLIQYSARATFGEKSFVLLNAFALGPWATGMNVSMSLVDRCIVKSIGPDVGKIVATLELLGPKYKYVIAGYPPFLKLLVDTAGIDWSRYDVCAVVGGEGMSEALRAALNRCFRKTVSSFGASDLEINLAVETDFTIALRQALASTEAVGHALYGREGLPMIFQFDPLNAFIESTQDRSLLVTLNRLDNVAPKIRYDIHDRGVVFPMRTVLDVLRTHDVQLEQSRAALALPLLFHWGRQDNAVGFYGCKITPEDIQHALLCVPELAGTVAHFALHPFEDSAANKRLHLYLELAEDARLTTCERTLGEWVWREVAAVNQDFRESIRMVPPDRRPMLRLFKPGTSPMSCADVRLKRSYIV